MLKRIAGLVAIAVIASQALMGTAGALTSVTTNGLGDPYSGRAPDTDCDNLDRGYAAGEDSLYIGIEGNYLFCSDDADANGGGAYGRESVLLSEIREPLEIVAGGNVYLFLYDWNGSEPVDFQGLEMEVQAGATLYFEAGSLSPAVGDRGARLTVTDTGATGHGLGGMTILNAAHVAFWGSSYDDLFDASATTADIPNFSTIWGSTYPGVAGNGGNDVLKGGSGVDNIDGGSGDDTISGGAGDDVLYGDDDNDKLFGGAGNDYLECEGEDEAEQCWGNEGDDTLYMDPQGAGLTVAPGDGDDELQFYGNTGSITLFYGDTSKGQAVTVATNDPDDCSASNFGEDHVAVYDDYCTLIHALVGSPHDDVFSIKYADDYTLVAAGGGGNDVLIGDDEQILSGGDGDDDLFGDDRGWFAGGAGNDKIVSGDQNHITGGAGNDYITGSGHHRDNLVLGFLTAGVYGGPGNDRIHAEDGDSATIYAGKGNDLVFGTSASDSIYLGQGNDRVAAGSGDDKVLGGPGDDQIRGQGGDDWLYGGTGRDRVIGDADDFDPFDNSAPYSLQGDHCEGEVVESCEYTSTMGPAGPYWVRIVKLT